MGLSLILKVIIALLSFSMLSVFVCGILGKSTKKVEAAETYKISSPSDWNSFQNECVNKDGALDAVLLNDIDFGGAEIYQVSPSADYSGGHISFAYSGTFNGNGHTLSNFKIKGSWSSAWDYYTTALFCNTYKATIKNLKIKNATYQADNVSSNYTLSIGAFVGLDFGGTTISQCVCDNVSLGDDGYYTYNKLLLCGGIMGHQCGVSQSSIIDCYVVGLKVNFTICSQYASAYDKRVLVGGLVYDENDYANLSRCVFDRTGFQMDVKVKVPSNNDQLVKSMTYDNGVLTGNDVVPDQWESRAYCFFAYTSFKATTSYSSGTSLLHQSWSNVTSSNGGADAADSSGKVYIWYHNTAYNNSLPVLRQFVEDWKDYLFTSTNSEVARISGNNYSITITVPSDYDDNKVHINSSDNSLFVVEGVNENIYVTVIDNHYEFTGWNKYQNKIIANIELKAYDITFNLTDYFDELGLDILKTFKINKMNNTINISLTVSQICITFEDKDGVQQQIKYVISDQRYCVDKVEIRDESNNLETTITGNNNYSVEKGINISAYAKLKSYGLVLN